MAWGRGRRGPDKGDNVRIRDRLSLGNIAAAALAATVCLLGACSDHPRSSQDDASDKDTQAAFAIAAPRPALARAASAQAAAAEIANPILFVTQVPMDPDQFPGRMNTFANHMADLDSVPRGGDLWIRYPNGDTRNLTEDAGFGNDGPQRDKAIAVREPAVHWSGQKAIFSMLIGAAPEQYERPQSHWQLYEVTGFLAGQTLSIKKVPKQPGYPYSNVAPFYASDGQILFTSDRPRGGEAHLYPQVDEYESTPTVAGIYKLDPVSGALKLLNHTVSGAFSPSVDSFGRIVFIRWDHLQRDQQNEEGTAGLGAYNRESEAQGAKKLPPVEVFPEFRGKNGDGGPYGTVSAQTNNLFTPWQMNQDGTDELTLNHIGRHELFYNAPGILPVSFLGDNALQAGSNPAFFANRTLVRQDNGLFHLREDPLNPGLYYAVSTDEFGRMTTDQLVSITGAPSLNAEQMKIEVRSAGSGRFRNPLPMSTGQMVATAYSEEGGKIRLRIQQLNVDGAGKFVAGTPLTPGINKTLSWFTPDTEASYSGQLWELDPVEVVARTPPPAKTAPVDPVELGVIEGASVDVEQLQAWMRERNLALIVTRNQTSRDRNDKAQPYNLEVPGGIKTIGNSGKVYPIVHYQILQANQVRGYNNYNGAEGGLRPIAQPMAVHGNPENPAGPLGSVRIADDGSTAAFVPALRALTWQTTDGAGRPIVRERVWVTMQPGEIRTCAGCHGENSKNQAGQPASTHPPDALRELMLHWLQNKHKAYAQNGAQPLKPKK